jgi:hypothetical protein
MAYWHSDVFPMMLKRNIRSSEGLHLMEKSRGHVEQCHARIVLHMVLNSQIFA